MFEPYFGAINPAGAGGAGAILPMDDYDYLVYISGGSYRAQNRDTGVVDFSDADLTDVMDDILANNYQSVRFRRGTYQIDSDIDLPIEQGCFIHGANIKSVIFNVNGNINGFHIQGDTVTSRFIRLGNFTMRHIGEGDDAVGILCDDAYDSWIHDIWFKDWLPSDSTKEQCCLRFDKNCWYLRVSNIRMQENIGNGINWYSDDPCDNGQALFENMTLSAAYRNFYRKPRTTGTVHRLELDRCGLYHPYAGPVNEIYNFDGRMIGQVLFNSCDFEGCGSDDLYEACVRIGDDSVFNNCQFFTQLNEDAEMVHIDDAAGATQGTTPFLGCYFYLADGSKVISPTFWGKSQFYGCKLRIDAGTATWVPSLADAKFFACAIEGGGAVNNWSAWPKVRSVISAGVTPTLEYDGEAVHWRDTTAGKSWLMIRVNANTYKVECT